MLKKQNEDSVKKLEEVRDETKIQSQQAALVAATHAAAPPGTPLPEAPKKPEKKPEPPKKDEKKDDKKKWFWFNKWYILATI